MKATMRVLEVDDVPALWNPMISFPLFGSNRFTAERHFIRLESLTLSHQCQRPVRLGNYNTVSRRRRNGSSLVSCEHN